MRSCHTSSSGGASTINKCAKVCLDLKEAMLRGGFNLAKWKFSSKALKKQVEKKIKELEEGEEK